MALFCGSLLNCCGSGPGAGDARMVFEDTIPCADCPGIIMNVQFDTATHSYIRTMTYLEATDSENDATFTSKGAYKTEKGYKGDENVFLYVLEGSPSGGEQVFLADGDSAIKMGRESCWERVCRHA